MTQTRAAPLYLGLDGGGTQTRWALCDAVGSVLASGAVEAIATLRMTEADAAGSALATLHKLASQLNGAQVAAVVAGMSGIGSGDEPAALVLRDLVAQALGVPPEVVQVSNDMVVAYADAFAPGAGYLIYAGTGSIAAFVDENGQLHRAGGRGGILDDGGSGYWIAREALRHIWRLEDERPGAWQDSPLAVRVFAHLGGSDWALTRAFVYAGHRGAMGELALAVAAAAGEDLVARQILHRAGEELARLARAMVTRFGPRPLALGGRVSLLHPSVMQSLRSHLPPAQELRVASTLAQVAAARLAARASKVNP